METVGDQLGQIVKTIVDKFGQIVKTVVDKFWQIVELYKSLHCRQYDNYKLSVHISF